MLGLYSVYMEQTYWASPLPPESHLQVWFCPLFIPRPLGDPRLGLSSSRSQRRKLDCGGWADTMMCVPGSPRYHPLPAPVPKAQLKSCVKGLQLAQLWKTRKTSKEECGRILLPLLRHPEPPARVVSAFLFPESAKPAEAAKWETWGTLN